MLKNLFYLTVVILLCSSCVSRTTYKQSSLKGSNPSGKPVAEKKLIWIWDKDYSKP
jgi:hypothetical protein